MLSVLIPDDEPLRHSKIVILNHRVNESPNRRANDVPWIDTGNCRGASIAWLLSSLRRASEPRKPQPRAYLPAWLQERYGLGNLKLTIPNYLGKFYKSVRIDVCRRCNNEIFSQIEDQVRNGLVRSSTRESFDKMSATFTVVRWLCKILLLNIFNSKWNADYRELKAGRKASIPSDGTVKRLSSVCPLLRSLIENKHFQCLFPITGTPFLA